MDELEAAQALAGPIIDMEPVCPLCGHKGGKRLERHRKTRKTFATPCYLTWSASGGVTAAYRKGADKPPFEMIPTPDGAGNESAYERLGVQCDECEYVSAPSAFCRPTGPPLSSEAKLY